MESSPQPKYILVLFPKRTNEIVPELQAICDKAQSAGLSRKFVDLVFLGTTTSSLPLNNFANRDTFLRLVENAMRRTIKPGEKIPFRVVEGVSPLVSTDGMGLVYVSPFLQHLTSSLGFRTNPMFVTVIAERNLTEDDMRAARRIFENPDDGMFHCRMNPSQWELGILDAKRPEYMCGVIDLQRVVPEVYVKLELENKVGNDEAMKEAMKEVNKLGAAGAALESDQD